MSPSKRASGQLQQLKSQGKHDAVDCFSTQILLRI